MLPCILGDLIGLNVVAIKFFDLCLVEDSFPFQVYLLAFHQLTPLSSLFIRDEVMIFLASYSFLRIDDFSFCPLSGASLSLWSGGRWM
jgi:hypothetical protein